MTTTQKSFKAGENFYLSFYDVFAKVEFRNRLGAWVPVIDDNEDWGFVRGERQFIRNNNLY